MEPRAGGGYSVRYREHPISPESEGSGGARTLTADRLILSAGSLGSTYLLLRNRSAFPRVSKLLGTRFGGNGDYLTFALKASGESGGRRIPRVIDPGYGPTITSAARGDDELDGGEGRGFYLEDAGFPQHVAWMLQMFGLPGPLWRLVKRRFLWDWLGESADPYLSVELSDVLGNMALSAGLLPWVSSPASSGYFGGGLAATENAAIGATKDLPSGIYPVTTKDVPPGRCAGSPPRVPLGR